MTADGTTFRTDWVRRAGWKVVPAESGVRFGDEDIRRIIPALNAAGYSQCLAVTTEDLGDRPSCYIVSIDETGFRELNRELGVFRFVVTHARCSWGILCNEWYNLYGGPVGLVEAMLGMPMAQARERFLHFATSLAKGDRDYPLLEVARNCEAAAGHIRSESGAGGRRQGSEIRVKVLPDGRRAVLRKASSDGTATLEIQPAGNNEPGVKVRYPEDGRS